MRGGMMSFSAHACPQLPNPHLIPLQSARKVTISQKGVLGCTESQREECWHPQKVKIHTVKDATPLYVTMQTKEQGVHCL